MTGPTEKLLLLQVVASLRIFSFVSCRYAALIIVSLQPTLLFRNNPEVFSILIKYFCSISGGVLGFWGGVWCLGIIFLLSLMMQRSTCRKGDDRKKVCKTFYFTANINRIIFSSKTFQILWPCAGIFSCLKHTLLCSSRKVWNIIYSYKKIEISLSVNVILVNTDSLIKVLCKL